MIIGDNLS